MSRKINKPLNTVGVVQVLGILLVIFWVFSWFSGYIKEVFFLYYGLLLLLIILIATFLIIKSSNWFKLIWVLILLASIGASILMVVSYNLSFNLQY